MGFPTSFLVFKTWHRALPRATSWWFSLWGVRPKAASGHRPPIPYFPLPASGRRHHFFSSPVASWVRYALMKPSRSPHPARRGRAGTPHGTQMVGQSPPISRSCFAGRLDAAPRREMDGRDAHFFSSPVASWVRYALMKPSRSPHPARRGRAGAPHGTQMVGQSPPISRSCFAGRLDAAPRREMDGRDAHFFSSPVASWVRYALMKPSKSPSITLSMLPVS